MLCPRGRARGGQVTSPLPSTATPRPRVPPRGATLRPWGRAGLLGTGVEHSGSDMTSLFCPTSQVPWSRQFWATKVTSSRAAAAPPTRPRPLPRQAPPTQTPLCAGLSLRPASGAGVRGAGRASSGVHPKGVCWFSLVFRTNWLAHGGPAIPCLARRWVHPMWGGGGGVRCCPAGKATRCLHTLPRERDPGAPVSATEPDAEPRGARVRARVRPRDAQDPLTRRQDAGCGRRLRGSVERSFLLRERSMF